MCGTQIEAPSEFWENFSSVPSLTEVPLNKLYKLSSGKLSLILMFRICPMAKLISMKVGLSETLTFA